MHIPKYIHTRIINVVYTFTHTVYTYTIFCIFFIHSSENKHLGCSHILSVVTNVDVNLGVDVSFQISVFVFFRFILRSETPELYGGSIFSCLRTLHTVFHSGYTNLHCIHFLKNIPIEGLIWTGMFLPNLSGESNLGILFVLKKALGNYGLLGKPPDFANKLLLKHNHNHLLTHYI